MFGKLNVEYYIPYIIYEAILKYHV